ncbi:MAG: hypothetical protein DDT40_01706 [candidate division WS2 bacterium]|nr:hypothetical protein [Candidatus Psychracetigena formicireducens]
MRPQATKPTIRAMNNIKNGSINAVIIFILAFSKSLNISVNVCRALSTAPVSSPTLIILLTIGRKRSSSFFISSDRFSPPSTPSARLLIALLTNSFPTTSLVLLKACTMDTPLSKSMDRVLVKLIIAAY